MWKAAQPYVSVVPVSEWPSALAESVTPDMLCRSPPPSIIRSCAPRDTVSPTVPCEDPQSMFVSNLSLSRSAVSEDEL